MQGEGETVPAIQLDAKKNSLPVLEKSLEDIKRYQQQFQKNQIAEDFQRTAPAPQKQLQISIAKEDDPQTAQEQINRNLQHNFDIQIQKKFQMIKHNQIFQNIIEQEQLEKKKKMGTIVETIVKSEILTEALAKDQSKQPGQEPSEGPISSLGQEKGTAAANKEKSQEPEQRSQPKLWRKPVAGQESGLSVGRKGQKKASKQQADEVKEQDETPKNAASELKGEQPPQKEADSTASN